MVKAILPQINTLNKAPPSLALAQPLHHLQEDNMRTLEERRRREVMRRKHTILERVQIPRWEDSSKEADSSSNLADHLHQRTLGDM
jgi:hypothetical protein